MNFPPPLCISGTAIGRDLKFYRDYNWFKPRSNTKFQINPMAPAPLRGADIRKTSIFRNEKYFFTQMAVISAVVGIFSRDRSHSKAKMKNFKKPFPYFFDFRTGSARKRGPKLDEISI